MVPGLERATELVLELCGGTAAKADVTGYAGYTPKVVDFPFAEVKRLTGLEVSTQESREILTRLGFVISGTGERVQVSVPSWRPDVDGKADLVEEVMRIHGVDAIKASPCRPRVRSMAASSRLAADPHPRRQARLGLARHAGSRHLVLHSEG